MNRGTLGYPKGRKSGLLGYPLGRMLPRATRVENVGTAASTRGVLVTAGAANTKGSYAEVISATTKPADGFYFNVVSRGALGAGGHANMVFDIAIGGAGSEVIVVPDILAGSVIEIGASDFWCPIPIPAGSRIAVRMQSHVASATVDVQVRLYRNSALALSLRRATAYGVNLTDSGGTEIDPGGSANTKSAWVTLTSATQYRIKHAHLTVTMASEGEIINADLGWLVDVAMGPVGVEEVLAENLFCMAGDLVDQLNPVWFPLPIFVPAGSRLCARAQCSATTAVDRLIDVSLIGFD